MTRGKASENDEAAHLSRLGGYDYCSPAIWCDQNHRRVIMAALVKSVYRMEKDRAAGLWKTPFEISAQTSATPMWWETFHYDMIYPLTDKEGSGSVMAAIFQSRLNHNMGHSGAPHKVVAFRGTMLKKIDIQADIHILFHELRCHDAFGMALHFVRQEVAGHGAHSVCLAGHSKGAALALLVGRKLAEEQHFLETHLFNPPYPTVPVEPLQIPDMAYRAHILHNVVANALSHVLQNEETRKLDSDAFLAIRPWFPHLYVNVSDPVCASYIGYFQVNCKLPKLSRKWYGFALTSTPQSIRSILRSSAKPSSGRPDHLVPSAYLHVNQSWNGIVGGHKLKQWLDLSLQLTPLKMEFNPDGDFMTSKEL